MYGFYLEVGDMKNVFEGPRYGAKFYFKQCVLVDLQIKSTNFIVYFIFSIFELDRDENVINLGSNESHRNLLPGFLSSTQNA